MEQLTKVFNPDSNWRARKAAARLQVFSVYFMFFMVDPLLNFCEWYEVGHLLHHVWLKERPRA